MACHVKKGDTVEVIAGDHKGEQGKILRILLEKKQVIVRRHQHGLQAYAAQPALPAGRPHSEGSPRSTSANVLPVDPKTGKGSRVKFETARDAAGKATGKKRVTVKGTVLNDLY